MLYAKFGWYWISVSREEAQNVQKSMTDERRRVKTDSNVLTSNDKTLPKYKNIIKRSNRIA